MTNRFSNTRRIFKHWWISLITGILSIAAGVCCFAVPADSLAILTWFFIVILIAGGIFNIVWAARNRKWNETWGWGLARGIMELLLGLWLLMLPLPAVTTSLIYLIGFLMLFNSITGICESCALAELSISGWGWLLACNILSLICSFIFMAAPVYGGIFILVYIGLSFILYGIFRSVVAFKWRRFNKRADKYDTFVDAEVIE